MSRRRSLSVWMAVCVWASGGIAAPAPQTSQGVANAEQDVVVIASATVRTDDGSLPERVASLPSQHVRSPRQFKRFSLDAHFDVRDPQDHALWALYVASFAHGGIVRINGVEVGKVQTSDERQTVWHTRPYLFPVPSSVLHAGSNRLEIHWGGRESLTLLSALYFGPADVMDRPYRQRLFWQNTMAQVALVHALVIAAILLGIFALRRHLSSYLSLGVGALGFSIIMFTYMLPPMPGWFYPAWRAIHIGGIALFTSGAWLFLIREAAPQSHRFARFCVLWATSGPTVYLIHFALTGVTFFKSFETAWGVASGIIGLYPVGLLAQSLWRRWDWRKCVFVVATLCAIMMGVADVLLQGTARSLFGNVGYSLQIVSPLWFTALTLVLVLDFSRSLIEEDEQRRRMAQELAVRERELALLYETNQKRERDHATQQERQRIMQDMHDGLGSHLISSLAMSERGQLSAEQTSALLRDCIDDLRLAIDTLSSSEASLALTLGSLRFRMVPRLKAAGITVHWSTSELPEELEVSPAITLSLLRIMQEAMTNVLKHAGASNLWLSVALQDSDLTVVLEDDGIGFDSLHVSRGKGLNGIAKRARTLGAEISIERRSTEDGGGEPSRPGTRVALRLALDSGHVAG